MAWRSAGLGLRTSRAGEAGGLGLECALASSRVELGGGLSLGDNQCLTEVAFCTLSSKLMKIECKVGDEEQTANMRSEQGELPWDRDLTAGSSGNEAAREYWLSNMTAPS